MSAGPETPSGDEQEAIGRMLAALPPIEPPRATVQRTQAALQRARDKRGVSWVGRLGLVAAGALATVGLTYVGRELDRSALSPEVTLRLPAGVERTETAYREDLANMYTASGEGEGDGLHDYTGLVQDNQNERGRFTLGGEPAPVIAQVAPTPAGNDGSGVDGDRLGWTFELPAGHYTIDVQKQGYVAGVGEQTARDLDGEGRAGFDPAVVTLELGRQEPTTRSLDAGATGKLQDGRDQAGEAVAAMPDSGDLAGRDATVVDVPRVGRGEPSSELATVVDKEAKEESDRWWRHEIDGLTFLPASGWFANTYRPGDRDLAALRQSVARGIYRGPERVRLDELAAAPAHTLRGPSDRAIGLQVTSDVTAVEGPTRMTVQVTLAGAERGATQRSPVALALVVDLGSIAGDAERRLLWGVADRVAAARGAGDHMALVVPVGGGRVEVLRGDALTPGAATRFLALRAEALGATALGPADLRAAVAAAYAEVAAIEGEPAHLIATRGVVVATARPGRDPELEAMARTNALAGAELSFIAVGAGADAAAAGEVAAAGLGRRWIVQGAEDAERVVEAELAAAGRAVARALRLQLKLAPGVRLVEVLGSRPLSRVEKDHAAAVEDAIEREREKNAGIAVDAERDKPEDGIQIAIPTFMANDQHVILLDVVVPGPGPVLDVRARYKDLVRVANGETQAALEVTHGRSQATPLTLEVAHNREAFETARTLLDAARHIGARDVAGALSGLDARHRRLVAYGAAGAGDAALVGAYAEVLRGLGPNDQAVVEHVARSLRLSAAIRTGAR